MGLGGLDVHSQKSSYSFTVGPLYSWFYTQGFNQPLNYAGLRYVFTETACTWTTDVHSCVVQGPTVFRSPSWFSGMIAMTVIPSLPYLWRTWFLDAHLVFGTATLGWTKSIKAHFFQVYKSKKEERVTVVIYSCYHRNIQPDGPQINNYSIIWSKTDKSRHPELSPNINSTSHVGRGSLSHVLF